MSVLDMLVLLHVGATAALLLVLGVVIVLQRVGLLVGRSPVPTHVRSADEQVVLGLDPRAADRRASYEPSVAVAAHRSS